MATAKSLTERFFERFRKDQTGCWIWTATLEPKNGYGIITGSGRPWPNLRAHRVSWEIHNGPIPPGLHVLHRCDNPPCVNPAHLFVGTNAENMRDRNEKQRHAFGEGQPQSKLTNAMVLEIRSCLASGESLRTLGARFGVDFTCISLIKRRRTWKHI